MLDSKNYKMKRPKDGYNTEKESVFYIIGVGKFGKHEFCSSFLETWDSIIFEHQYHCVPIGSN